MATKKLTTTSKPSGRPKPLVPKAGATKSRRRYPDGGKVSK